MKTKLLFICALLFAMSQTFAQVYMFEPFDYSPVAASILDGSYTNTVTNTTWTDRQGGDDDMLIQADPGWSLGQAFDLNPTGNAIQFEGGGEDAVLPFANPLNASNSGPGNSVYLSFFIDITGYNSSSVSEYRMIHFGVSNGSGGYNAGSGMMVGPGAAANTFKIGYSNSDVTGDAVWFGTEYSYQDLTDPMSTPVSNQFFIVIKFTFGVGGGTDGYMWVNPAVNTAEPAADLTQDSSLASKSRSQFDAFNIEASSNARTPNCFLDEIRVAGTWEEATGQAPPLSVSKNELDSKIKMYPNPAKDYIQIESKDIQIASVEMYSLVGKKLISQKSLANDRLDISALSSGIYLLKVNAEEGGSLTRKIVVE